MKIKCWECGKIVEQEVKHSEIPEGVIIPEEFLASLPSEPSFWYRCYCDECYKRVYEEEKRDIEEYIRLKKKGMFRRALRILEHQATDMYDYKDAIKVVEDFLNAHLDKFDSSYEIVAAIVLVKNRIHSKMQYKIGKYQVDFLLPEWYVVLEIDGVHHKLHKKADSNRDAYIKRALGNPWEIVRIKTDYLDMNAKALPDAIQRVLQYREEGKINWRELYDT